MIIKASFKVVNLKVRLDRGKNRSGERFGSLRLGVGKGMAHMPTILFPGHWQTLLIDLGTLSDQN